MCERYRLTVPAWQLAESFQAWDEIECQPNFNVAPTDNVVTVRAVGGKRKISNMRWEFIPRWASRNTRGHFNARAEKVMTTPSFSDAMISQRCLIPASAFYEWQQMGSVKQPFCFELTGRDVFAFAGLWDQWNGRDGCVIMTTVPNAVLESIGHDRMPVIIDPENYDAWLSSPVNEALALLNAYDATRMSMHPVNRRLNDARNKDPEAATRIELNVPVLASLF
jgi:putative SOS response-associated peptidase YedK